MAKKEKPRRPHGAGSIREHHTGGYQARVSVGGKRFDKVLPTQAAAASWIRKTVEEQKDRKEKGLPGPMSFSQILTRFETKAIPKLAPNTQRTYKKNLQSFRTYFVSLG